MVIVEFDTYTAYLPFPFKVDDLDVDNKVPFSFPIELRRRRDVIAWVEKEVKFGIELSHEPFLTGNENPQTVMEYIEQQRLVKDREFYIDDFGFYVYFRVINDPILKDLRYD